MISIQKLNELNETTDNKGTLEKAEI